MGERGQHRNVTFERIAGFDSALVSSFSGSPNQRKQDTRSAVPIVDDNSIFFPRVGRVGPRKSIGSSILHCRAGNLSYEVTILLSTSRWV